MKRIVAAAGTGLLLALVAAAPGAAQIPCVPRHDIEMIVADSQAMRAPESDPRGLRVRALQLFVTAPWNDGKRLGAVKFADAAQPLFPPGASNRGFMARTLGGRLGGSGGGLNYDAAFALASAQNPSADARIFITNGGHDAGPYAGAHRGGPSTYVIGLGPVDRDDADRERLRTIVSETNGWFPTDVPRYPGMAKADLLPALLMDASATFDCWARPVWSTRTFRRPAQIKRHRARITRGNPAARLAVTWTDDADRFTVRDIEIRRGRRLVASAARSRGVRHLRVTRRRGATFGTYEVDGVVPGSLHFEVKAARLSAPGARVVTQVATRRR